MFHRSLLGLVLAACGLLAACSKHDPFWPQVNDVSVAMNGNLPEAAVPPTIRPKPRPTLEALQLRAHVRKYPLF